jgi:microcystin degradation protein MlrC
MNALRIAIVGLSVEALIGSPLKTDETAMQTYRGDELPAGNLWLVRGMLDRLREERDMVAVPLLWSTALPGGALTRSNYAAIKQETLERLAEKGPFDGVLVANHGALEVDAFDVQADADFLVSVREAVGSEVPIGVALDLHGHMSEAMLKAGTVFSALRTAPHRDDRQTGYRAAAQLVDVLRRELHPRTAAVHIPILTAGEAAVTTQEPGASLYATLPRFDAREGVMEANILVGFAFNDRPWTGMTALVTGESDIEVAERHAVELAQVIWDRRHEFVLRMETAEVVEGLARAAASTKRPVYVSDSGDNTTAGAPGDLTGVLQAVLANPDIKDAVVPGIYAPKLVKRALALGKGSPITFELGEEHISEPGTRVPVEGLIENSGPQLTLGGFQPYRSTEGAWASIRIGSTIATFHDQPIGITTPGHFRAMGIDPLEHAVYVVKLGYLHPQIEDIAARHILLLSEGTVSLNLKARLWTQVRRPAHPIDENIIWSPAAGLYSN